MTFYSGHIIGGPADADYDGAVLTADLSIGDTLVSVDDTADFDEDGSRRDAALLLGVDLGADGEPDAATGTVAPYKTAYDEDGVATYGVPPTEHVGTANTVELLAPATVSASTGDRVFIQDPVSGGCVGRLLVQVALDDADTTGDSLTAYLDVALLQSVGDVSLTDLAVDVGEDDDGQLYVSAFPGLLQHQGGVKFMQDAVTVVATGDQTMDLSFVPKVNSEHLYWNGLYQPGTEWSRDRWTVTVPDPSGVIQVGHRLVMEYAYEDPGIQTFATYDDAFLGLNVLGRWDLDDTSGTVAHATVGTDGTIINSPALAQPGLVIDGGTAIATTWGLSQDITLPISGYSVSSTDPAWITFWFKYGNDRNPFSVVVFRDDTGPSSVGYLLALDGSDVVFRADGVNHTVTGLASSAYLDGNRHMCLYSQAGLTCRLFLDGVLVDTWTKVGAPSFWDTVISPLHFGRFGTQTQYASFTYDRVAIGAASVSEAQATAIWEAGR